MDYKIKISSRVYADAFKEGWLNSLAVYVLICKVHSGRSFYFKPNAKTKMLQKLSTKTGIGQTALNKHIRILATKGLVDFTFNGEMKFKSFKKNKTEVGKTIFVGKNINNLSDIKFVLKAIPFLSNLKTQETQIFKKERHNQYQQSHKRNQNRCGLSKKDINPKLMCSITKMSKLLNKNSESTICIFKKRLKKLGLINFTNESYILIANVNKQQFQYMKKVGIINCNHAFFMNNNVCVNRPTEFTITHNTVTVS